jgi:hypothetical protein
MAKGWQEHQESLERFTRSELQWLTEPLPDSRQEVMAFVDGMMGALRDLAVSAAAGERFAAHARAPWLRNRASAIDVELCIAAAFELVALRESADRFVSPRLVASLAREKWISLIRP